jgi:hypothetical protein
VTDASHPSAPTTAPSEEAWPEEVSGMPRDEGLYYKKNRRYVRIFGTPVAGTSGGSFKQSALPFSGYSQRGEVGGKHAQVQVTERQPIFYAYVPENYEPGSSSLMRLDVKGDRREFQVGSVSGMSGRHRSGLDPKKIQQCTTESIARLYRVTPARELEDGEYAFIRNYIFTTSGVAGAGEKVYDFGISKKK